MSIGTVSRRFSTSRLHHGFLKSPHYDVKHIIDNSVKYKESISKRKLLAGNDLLTELENLPGHYANIKDLNKEISHVQMRRNQLELQIKKDSSLLDKILPDIKLLKLQFQKLSQELNKLQNQAQSTGMSLPNLLHHSVPATKPVIIKWINPISSYVADHEQDHVKVMTNKKMLDMQTASNVTGSSWYYLLNDGVELQQALISFALDKAKQFGFQKCIPPSVVRNEIISACGFRPQDMNNERQVYHIQDSQLGLAATAEIPLAGLNANKVLDLDNAPIKIAGVNRSYRAEAGAHGKDTKGLYRVHEFAKVELFCWAKQEESNQVLEDLVALQIDIIQSLGLSAKVLNMPANDLGSPAFKKYDIEAWMPGRGAFGEITSTSNCTDFQSRRLNTKYKDNRGKLQYVHTLNGTAMAVPRVMLALVESFYDVSTDRIHIPDVLQPYMDGKQYI